MQENKPVKILQISDMHLFANDEQELFGVKNNLKFKEVFVKILEEDIADTDIIFLTGDISQDETVESYQKIVNALDSLNKPVYWIPGNHDNLLIMQNVFSHAKNFIQGRNLSLAHWDLIFLNSAFPDRIDGVLSQAELDFMEKQLSQASKKIAIIMHHHPAPVGTPLIDKHILFNRSEFWELAARFKTELIICGHVHGDYQFKYHETNIESANASCFQFPKGITELQIGKEIGYKIYYLERDGYKSVAKIW